MADNISALKALYDALGGTLSSIPADATNADVIEAIAAQIQEGGVGSSLPTVTSDDNGDVLTVVEGEWAPAAPSGGGSDIFVVHFSWDADDSCFVCDKTMAEIDAALKAGQIIIATDNDLSGGISIYSEFVLDESSNLTRISFDFWEPAWGTTNGFWYQKIVMTEESITDTGETYLLTPST